MIDGKRVAVVVPATARRPAGGETWREDTFARSLLRLMPLRSETLRRTDSERTISLTVLGFVASPGTGAPPFGENGWPR